MLKRRNKTITILLFALCFMISSNISQFYFGNYNGISIGEQNMDQISDINVINDPKAAANEPNGKPLLVNQFANTSKSYVNSNLPINVSFTLAQDWISKDVTISYEGVSQKKNRVINGTFNSVYHGWIHKSNGSGYSDEGWLSGGNPNGSVQIKLLIGSNSKGDYAYYEQNVSIQEELSSNKLALLSFDYYSEGSRPENISAYLAIKIGNLEKNMTLDFPTYIQSESWETLTMVYDPVAFGQVLPGNVTVRVGVYTLNNTNVKQKGSFQIDNIKFDLWTMPNQMNLVNAYDLEFPSNYSYTNTTFGKGYSYIDTERTRSETEDITFTISKNITGIDDFDIKNITITSNLLKKINSTINGLDGSLYTNGIPTIWQTELIISMPSDYEHNRAEITKPTDWNITHVHDGYVQDRISSCSGIGPGSTKFIIPDGVLSQGLWRIEVNSWNYISGGNIGAWNGSKFVSQSSLTYNDKFQVNITLNDTISFQNTQINCTIKYPNGTTFWDGNQEPQSENVKFGNFIVGSNMSVGDYQVIVEWTNNNTYLTRDQVGFAEFGFKLWHHTNLTAVDSYFEQVAGDPLLIKVRFLDDDINEVVHFAYVKYNSTFGASGAMGYLGSGVYFIDIDTSSLGLGDYYFSFNTTLEFYENQTAIDLIHLKIITQSLALEVPSAAINAMANSYAICQVNVTGAISGALIPGDANITTDWDNPYQVTNDTFGTFTLNFSTIDIPTQGVFESFTITVFANKTDYGATTGFITLIVNPIQTIADANKSIVNAYLNEVIDLKVNYTIEDSNELISGAICNVEWQGASNIVSVADGFIISLDTKGLSIDHYTALIKLEHVGYANAFKSVIITISEQNINLKVAINSLEVGENSLVETSYNEVITLSCRACAALEQIYLSGGTITFINEQYEQSLVKYDNSWFSTSILISTSTFSLGINYVYIKFQQDNYTTTTFSFQILVNQIEFDVQTIDFQDSIEVNTGEKIQIRINLTEFGTMNFIGNATISYSWDFGLGNFEEIGDGIYELELVIPENIRGNYKITLIILKEGTVYKTTQYSFLLVVKEPEFPIIWIGIILAILAAIISVLGILSLRAYVFLPKKKKRDLELQQRIQLFRDVWNIQAFLVIHKKSGLPIYNKNISILKNKDETIISGFIQAIIIFSEALVDGDTLVTKINDAQDKYSKNVLELDFKYFYLLICEYEAIRTIIIIKERSSNRLRKQLYLLAVAIYALFPEKLEHFMGSLTAIKDGIDVLLNQFLFLYYYEPFSLTNNESYFNKIKNSGDLTTMETRIINVILLEFRSEKFFKLNTLVGFVHEENKDLVLDGIRSLIKRKILVSPYLNKFSPKINRN